MFSVCLQEPEEWRQQPELFHDPGWGIERAELRRYEEEGPERCLKRYHETSRMPAGMLDTPRLSLYGTQSTALKGLKILNCLISTLN